MSLQWAQGIGLRTVRGGQPAARGLQTGLGDIMTNNSEFEMERWEYEGGSIGRQETLPEKSIAAHGPPTLHLRTFSTDGGIGAFVTRPVHGLLPGSL